jgi:hypothetical protein
MQTPYAFRTSGNTRAPTWLWVGQKQSRQILIEGFGRKIATSSTTERPCQFELVRASDADVHGLSSRDDEQASQAPPVDTVSPRSASAMERATPPPVA